VIETRRLRFEVLHMPGHTPGLLCLFDRERRIFVSDDHLLERVSPNPLIELGPNGEAGAFRPLLAYLASAARLRALDVDLVLPGHGPAFSGHREVIDRLVGFYEKRQARIGGLLAGGPLTPYAVSRALFPAAKPADVFLTISETIANLEVLEEQGRVRREERDGTIRFAAAV
jgi:glyoxylase-like metal-dependent hydrolase (beta-lactamase superfamily II)